MNLTDKQELELMQVYNTWWDSYLNGDVETYDSFLDDDFRFVGSTNGEEYLNRKDTTDFFAATADQLAGKADLRNVIRNMDVLDGLVLITDLADAYVLSNDEWIFYSRFRFTCLMRENEDGWKFVYQHFSAPDSKAQEGETLGTEKITQENLELREAIKRRTIELEHKTKELEIESSLERVRTAAMSIRKTADLADVSEIIFTELKALGFTDLRNSEVIINKDTEESILSFYYSDYGVTGSIEVLYKENTTVRDWANQLKTSCDAFATVEISEDKMDEWRDYREEIGYVPDPKLNEAKSIFYYSYSTGLGALSISSFLPISDSQLRILEHFKNVFGLAYRRYADVSRAEAQAREVEIELALERVRSKAMAMRTSDDLAVTASAVFTELRRLGIAPMRCGISIHNRENRKNLLYAASSSADGDDLSLVGWAMLENHPVLTEIYDSWLRDEDYYPVLEGELLNTYYEQIKKAYYEQVKNEIFDISAIQLADKHFGYFLSFSHGVFYGWSDSPIQDEEKRILKRFTSVVDLTFKRYFDLQKAEEQTREAQIELGLERVRARAMAMQSSEELADLVDTVFKELTKLDFALSWCMINIVDESALTNVVWATNPAIGKPPESYHMKFEDYPFHHAVLKGYRERKSKLVYELKGLEKKSYMEYLFHETEFSRLPEHVQAEMRASRKLVASFTFSNFGGLQTGGEEPLPDKSMDILARFGKVFDLTYTRFNDLLKAEAQTREAQIEAALERTRTQSMLMQHSDELDITSQVFHAQLKQLGIRTAFSYLWLLNEEKEEQTFWATYSEEMNDAEQYHSREVSYHLDKTDPYMAECLTAWKRGDSTHRSLIPQAEVGGYMTDWKELFGGVKNMTPESFPDGLRFVDAYMKYGTFGLVSDRDLSDEEYEILRRFAIEFERTYTRFLDLKKAEMQAQKAKVEVALERVRARALAMQNPEELKEVAQVLRAEMGLLGVKELETGSIYIHEEGTDIAECWYALRDVRDSEKELISGHFALNLNDTWLGREMIGFYNSTEEQISIGMSGSHANEWVRKCEELSEDFRGYYSDELPDWTYHLCKFSHGAIAAASTSDISEDNRELLKRAASVFSLAYSRFKDLTQAHLDLQQLKTEKHRAEDALTELKAAQSQLIHAEKMASLGELTAGIAHEIQNPLNFVNNFSEVSNELIEEMHEEIENGDLDEAKAIGKDIKQNLEKIHHHGKRADAIVKGMLQHSRSSSGVKEPTDINALANEYLRLAYHGLRAKDNTFNATLKSDYDESIESINILPQDIGRVILNLITNAFYAVNEKKSLNIEKYEPTVSVSTKNAQGSIEVSVSDNGNGIPQAVLDKVFQPFFTTKPTGQGTGLGLSLSYDIVKAHDGELIVDTKDGEGTTFTIRIPV
jgi:signal transduction histidine kinase